MRASEFQECFLHTSQLLVCNAVRSKSISCTYLLTPVQTHSARSKSIHGTCSHLSNWHSCKRACCRQKSGHCRESLVAVHQLYLRSGDEMLQKLICNSAPSKSFFCTYLRPWLRTCRTEQVDSLYMLTAEQLVQLQTCLFQANIKYMALNIVAKSVTTLHQLDLRSSDEMLWKEARNG